MIREATKWSTRQLRWVKSDHSSLAGLIASTIAPFTGGDMAALFSVTAYSYSGYSGWTLLDENGDRTTIDHDIWGIGPDAGGDPSIINYGRYDSIRGELSWEYVSPPWEAGDCVGS